MRELLGKVVVRFSGVDPGDVCGIGEAVSYLDSPSFDIREGGKHVSWSARLVRAATAEEEIAYWKGLAQRKESHDR